MGSRPREFACPSRTLYAIRCTLMKKKSSYNVAVVGAKGAVGSEMIKILEERKFPVADIGLSSPGALVSTKFVPHAIKTGAVVIDNTSAFRMHPKVPLVIPEINPEDIKKHKGIIANPNCSAIIMLMAVAPLHRKNPIKRILCSTYQSASGAGAKAMRELETQTSDVLDGKPIKKEVFPHQIAFNLFSHNSTIEENGYNGEELKMIQESHKILHDDSIRI